MNYNNVLYKYNRLFFLFSGPFETYAELLNFGSNSKPKRDNTKIALTLSKLNRHLGSVQLILAHSTSDFFLNDQ